jgi:hypothetical protein
MPPAPEVYILNAEIGGNQKLIAGGGPQNGAIVADPAHYGAICGRACQATDSANQLTFSHRQ